MAVQQKNTQQQYLAMKMYFQKSNKSQILWKLKDSFGANAVSSRTLSYWISDFKKLGTEEISREAPFELHRMEEYGLPLEACNYISEMIYAMRERGNVLPLHPASKQVEKVRGTWKPTVREIQWWWRVHNMAEDFSYEDVYMMTTHYVGRELLELITGVPADFSDLNEFLTYKSWKSEQRTSNYMRAIKEGKIPAISMDNFLRGIGDAEVEMEEIAPFEGLWLWKQPIEGKHLTPYKSLVMTTYILSKRSMRSQSLVQLYRGEGFDISLDGTMTTRRVDFSREYLEHLFDDGELESIYEHEQLDWELDKYES